MKHCRALLKIDDFKEEFKFDLPNGSDALPSYCGSLCSVIMVITLLTYAALEFIIL